MLEKNIFTDNESIHKDYCTSTFDSLADDCLQGTAAGSN